ncbi:hypothetical protein C4M96_01865 [Mycoplasmopsis pullorum]|uniref:PfkB family carbohydrate kinase n=1 Tax=Mycoplasmopsis pullorum TaxID=48003 RepID=UPI00111A26A8|nr:PfkB family carbohydrate kinase [Mycoplasmopsis pullorum]TNK83096.1 hypothetical protein C4M93_02920 [Mycoplasmopsis pullorum]TNK92174.1 hypothetical protein C4M96_01865 [Mycoplasmopsis pullorum]
MLNSKKEKINYYNQELEKMQKLAKKDYYANHFAFKNTSQVKINQKLRNASPFLNAIHLSPFAGLMNDPNGLIYFKGYYYIFYQNVPQIAMHKTKLWSAYRTKDFKEYEDLEILITPSIAEDFDGVFSGGAINVDGKLVAYYTGNTKKWFNEIEFERGSATIMCEFDENKLQFLTKKVLFNVDKNVYTGDFRDPFPYYENGTYYLFHGAQLKDVKKGVISIYSSKQHDSNFKLLGTLKINNFATPDAYMYECPIYFKLDGYDVLSFSTQGQKYYLSDFEKNDHVLFLIGKMDFEKCEFDTYWVQHSDLGFDFYACQTFNNTPEQEVIYQGWAAKPQDFEIATFKHGYAHHLNFPRILSIQNNHLYQKPYLIDTLVKSTQEIKAEKILLEHKPYLLKLKTQNDFKIRLSNTQNDDILFTYENDVLVADRSNMSILEAVDTGLIYKRKVENIKNLEIIIDNSFIEIFINDGAEVFSSKYFINGQKYLEIENAKGEIMELQEFNQTHKKSQIVVLPGEALIDQYNTVEGTLKKVGGAPLNVAGAIQLLNDKTYFLGTIGSDENGHIIKNFFETNKLNQEFLEQINEATTVANVILDPNGERNFEFQRGADAHLKLSENLEFDVLVLSSATAFLGGELYETYQKLLNKAKKTNKIVFFDPNYRDALYSTQLDDFKEKTINFINQSDVIKLSDEELELVLDIKLDEIEKLNQFKNKLFLITLGEKGTLVFINNQSKVIPTISATVVDTTGAGDSFFGYFIAQFIEHNFDFTNLKIEDFEHIVFKSNICASFVIQKHGAIESLPSVYEIESKFNEELLKK